MKAKELAHLPAVVDAHRVAAVRGGLPDEEVLAGAVEVFKALANPLRLSVLHALSHDELSVGDLARALDLSLSATSQQLSYLRRLRLVAGRDDGRSTFYRATDKLVSRLVHDCLAHVAGLGAETGHAHPHRRRRGFAEPRAKRLSGASR